MRYSKSGNCSETETTGVDRTYIDEAIKTEPIRDTISAKFIHEFNENQSTTTELNYAKKNINIYNESKKVIVKRYILKK